MAGFSPTMSLFSPSTRGPIAAIRSIVNAMDFVAFSNRFANGNTADSVVAACMSLPKCVDYVCQDDKPLIAREGAHEAADMLAMLSSGEHVSLSSDDRTRFRGASLSFKSMAELHVDKVMISSKALSVLMPALEIATYAKLLCRAHGMTAAKNGEDMLSDCQLLCDMGLPYLTGEPMSAIDRLEFRNILNRLSSRIAPSVESLDLLAASALFQF